MADAPIVSKPASGAYREGYDRTFGKKTVKQTHRKKGSHAVVVQG